LGAFPALRAGNRAFRSNSSTLPQALPAVKSAGFPLQSLARSLEEPFSLDTVSKDRNIGRTVGGGERHREENKRLYPTSEELFNRKVLSINEEIIDSTMMKVHRHGGGQKGAADKREKLVRG
jgi:hypothetical protein